MTQSDFICDNCEDDTQNILYEGWFRTVAALNPFAKGTASAGLLQIRRLCEKCVKEFKERGLACATD